MLARNSKWCLLQIIALVVVALLAPPTGRASAAGADGQQEGVKVHGDWTIEIREPDGTLVTRREFKNSLTLGAGPNSSRGFLARLLKGSTAVKEWSVALVGSPEPCTASSGPSACFIFEPNSSVTGTNISHTLVVTLTAGDGLELSGSTTAVRASAISHVLTSPGLISGGFNSFTSKDLTSSPIAVAEGQIIQVKVVLTFS